jgi:hypothetical protein
MPGKRDAPRGRFQGRRSAVLLGAIAAAAIGAPMALAFRLPKGVGAADPGVAVERGAPAALILLVCNGCGHAFGETLTVRLDTPEAARDPQGTIARAQAELARVAGLAGWRLAVKEPGRPPRDFCPGCVAEGRTAGATRWESGASGMSRMRSAG